MRQILLLAILASSLHGQTEFSQESATGFLKILAVDIGPRPMGSPAERRALQYAMTKFREHGCDTAYILPFDRTGKVNTQSGTAVGIKRGATKRIILIGGHIDSAGPEIPGADDNGSGSAVVLELSRVFGRRATHSTLVFACFGGEEQGLEGSEYLVDHFAEIDSVTLMLNIDMANGLGTLDVDGDTYGLSAPSWLLCAAFEEFDKLPYENLRYPTHAFVMNYSGLGGAGSDHEPFLRKGIPAIDFTTDVTKPIHTPRDNFENFDARGLKRSGDLVAKLIERFDSGVPGKTLENYWLYTIGSVRIFVRYWALGLFLIITLIVAVAAFVVVRRRRIFPVDVRWSGLKMLLFTFVIVLLAWYSSNLVGLIKGYRYPWISEVSRFYVLAAVFGLGATWICLAISRKLHLSRCPYVFFKRTAIILTIYTVLFLAGGIELALYPASALFLFSLAVLVKNRFLKVFPAFLAPFLMMRLLFHEWIELFYHIVVGSPGSRMDLIAIPLYLLFGYPLFLGLCAVYRDLGGLPYVVSIFRSKWTGIGIAALGLGMLIQLYSRDVYSDLWYRSVLVDQRYKEPAPEESWKDTVILRSGEYLDGITIARPRGDSSITGLVTLAQILADGEDLTDPGIRRYGSRELRHRDHIEKIGDTTTFDISFTLVCTPRPYTLAVTYSSPGSELLDFSSPLLFTTEGKNKTLRWYSFPDSVHVAVRFRIAGSDSVRQRVEMVFDKITYPWRFEAERTDFIQRCRTSAARTYRYGPALATQR